MWQAEDDRIIIEELGIDTYNNFNLWLTDFDDETPEDKRYVVDVPCGDEPIDLTESLSGDVHYGQGKHTVTFTYPDIHGFEEVKSRLKNTLHGRKFDYRLSFDPLYTYTGRFSVSFSSTINDPFGVVTVEIEYNPYKLKCVKTECFNISDGITAYLSSGRKLVKPTFELSGDTIIIHEGKRYILPKGTYTINDVFFKQGTNEITFVKAGIVSHITHGEMSKYLHREMKTKPIYEWYRGILRHYVSRIVLTAGSTPTSGVVTFTATDANGNKITRTLDLGNLTLRAIGGEADTVTIYDNTAYIRKIIGSDGKVLPLPQSYTVAFPTMFSNEAEIVSLTHDSSARVSYETAEMNTERVIMETKHSDFMEDGTAEMTHEQMNEYTIAQLKNFDTERNEVYETETESIYIQYEWRDL